METVAILKRAAELTADGKWWGGGAYRQTGQRCAGEAMVSAICEARGVLWSGPTTDDLYRADVIARAFLWANDLLPPDEARLPFTFAFAAGTRNLETVARWNDDRSRSYEDVALAFKKAIYAAEEAA